MNGYVRRSKEALQGLWATPVSTAIGSMYFSPEPVPVVSLMPHPTSLTHGTAHAAVPVDFNAMAKTSATRSAAQVDIFKKAACRTGRTRIQLKYTNYTA